MTARTRKLSVALIALVAAVWVAWQVFPRHPAAPAPVSLKPAASSPAVPSGPAAAPEAVVHAPPASSAMESPAAPAQFGTAGPRPTAPASVQNETAATARMYAAHAPLRTPEVADPDSTANRQILQTMVLKALARSATPPAPVSAKP